MAEPLTLRCAIGKTPEVVPIRKGQAASDRIAFDLVEVNPLPPAFRRMIRDMEFDLTEMPVVTLAQARERGVPITGLPLPVTRGFHHGSLLCLEDSDIRGPADLVGRRIAVRSFPQTTGVWVRGILDREYGIKPEQTRWVVQEDAHVLDYAEPEYVSYAEPGQSLLDLLKSGAVDAITGFKGSLDGLRSVIPDADSAAGAWFERTGVFPVNHVLALRSDLLEKAPWLVAELVDVFSRSLGMARADGSLVTPVPAALRDLPLHSYSFSANLPSVQMLLDFAFDQQLFRQRWQAADLFPEFLAQEIPD